MSETKHTPGPWYLRANRHPDSAGRQWGWVDATPPGSTQTSIPGVRVEWVRGENSEANARLIAAAPTMLEALKEIDALPSFRLDEAGQIARAAIARAEGRS